MIPLDLATAAACFLFVALALVFYPWLFYTFSRRGKDRSGELKHLTRCPYCAHFFFGYQRTLLTCPRCKSFLNREEGHAPPSSPTP